ncbi:MAG: hypothetical protein V3T72_19045 [Thermoanaerobaculia bacterium]
MVEDLRERRSDALYTYLQGLLEDTSYINIRSIAPSAGPARGALRQPIEVLYTPLKSRGPGRPAAVAGGADTSALAEMWMERSVVLPELLGRHPRLLIEGQPGLAPPRRVAAGCCAPLVPGGRPRRRHRLSAGCVARSGMNARAQERRRMNPA